MAKSNFLFVLGTRRSTMAEQIKRRTFGSTGLDVSALGFGGAEIGFHHTSDKIVDVLLGMALDAGINVIDTAAMYAESEEKIGKVLLSGRRRKVLLFTKCGRFAPPKRSIPGFFLRSRRHLRGLVGRPRRREPIDWHPRALKWNIEQSLRRLRTDYIDVLQLHSCDEETLRRGEVINVLRAARDSGKVRYIGYTGEGRAVLYALRSGEFDAVQVSVNVADQSAFELILPLAAECGVGVIAKRPIANGLWRQKERPDDPNDQAYWDRLQKLQYAFILGKSDFEMALRFTLSVRGVHTAIVGTTNPEHLHQNIRHAELGPLTQEEFDAIRLQWARVSRSDWVGQL
jgi:aryl-alcohol dehydrogenase-like predicted oxidoreductase